MKNSVRQSSTNNFSGSRNVFQRVRKAWGESPIYQAQLKGPAPNRLYVQPEDPFTPDREFAAAFIRGRLALGDETIDCEGDLNSIWDTVDPEGGLYSFLHEFEWLRHLEAAGKQRESVARSLSRAWLDRYGTWSAKAWEPYFVSERLIQICAHYALVCAGGDAMWRSRVLTSMARQTRHLARTAHHADSGFDRLMTSLGLCIAGFCLPGCDGPAERGLEIARRELRLQLRPDGGHVSRNPSRQLKLAARLQMAAGVIQSRGFQSPGFLRHSLIRASAMAAFFRLGDGRLAIFNGGYEDDNRAILSIQSAVERESIPTDFARHSAYQKMSAGRALVIVDVGHDTRASGFQSAGSFHFSSGRSRIIVNCGNGGHRATDWGDALRKRAAHSALSFDSAVDRQITIGPVSARRVEDTKGQLCEIERTLKRLNGWGARYVRRLFLAAGGADLRGEETLEDMPLDAIRAATWRFHLHAQVKASLARDGKSVILLLPNKEGWRFKSNCPLLSLERSVYCGAGQAPAASEQIVIRGSAYEINTLQAVHVKWAVKRLDTA